MAAKPTLDDLFPESCRLLLTGTGKQFIERIGVETARRAVLGVLVGENLRDQTEPLTQQRIAQISAGIVTLFARGVQQDKYFSQNLSRLALEQMMRPKRDKASLWLAQWMIGLTGKSVQNVLRSHDRIENYIADFENAVVQAADKSIADIGDLKMTLGFIEDQKGARIELDWRDIIRLTTAVGTQTLTIRGSDKSLYGKLFERLILGSLLSILGFERVNPATNTQTKNVFWLSDSSDVRESDATLLLRPGKVVRFDIGFIGQGNPEISKDKLTRFAQLAQVQGKSHASATFIIVDRLPQTSKTLQMAKDVNAEIIQMSLQFWPRDLAQRLGARLKWKHALQSMPDARMESYLRGKLESIMVQNFVAGVATDNVQAETNDATTLD